MAGSRYFVADMGDPFQAARAYTDPITKIGIGKSLYVASGDLESSEN
jgi:hypothetical protein